MRRTLRSCRSCCGSRGYTALGGVMKHLTFGITYAPQCPLMTRSGPERLRVPCKLTPEPHFIGCKSLL